MNVELAKVDAVCQHRRAHANCDEDISIAFQTSIARELWESEDESYRQALLARRDQEHENDLREYVAQQDALTRAGSEGLQARLDPRPVYLPIFH